MRLIIFALMVFCVGIGQAAPPTETAWTPMPELSDEFNGSNLDSKKWLDHNPHWQGRPPGLYSTANVVVKDGFLMLKARSETLPRAALPYHDYTTSAVQSMHKVLYGYFEIRAKPMKSHVGSAFWFYDSTPQQWTEIDGFELGPLAPGHEKSYHMNLHVFRVPGYEATIEKHLKFPVTWNAPWRIDDDFHVYGVEWDKARIRWYVDGAVVRTADNQFWHFPLYLNFDTETMPDWLGLPAAGELPGEFLIDYVRTWKPVDGGVTDK